MATQRLSNEFMEKILNDAAWRELSGDYPWTEQLLEQHKDKVDWKAISSNCEIIWTPSMLDKFKNRLDWTSLSDASSQTLLHVSNLERFKDYWDWTVLSRNSSLKLTTAIIDKFMDQWDWSEIIDRYQDELYSLDFLEKYMDKIPANALQNSHLWRQLTEIRKYEIAYEIVS